MPNPGQELSTINFEAMLGGPLVAVVNAQAQAAMSTVNFIKEVGFKKIASATAGTQTPESTEVGDPVYVAFKYPKEVAPYQPPVPSAVSVTILTPGSGYTPGAPPVPTLAGGGATTQAVLQATVNAAGQLTEIRVTTPGTGYTSAPTITIPAPTGTNPTPATTQVNFTAAVGEQAARFQEMKLEVPILTMVPIPFIRIEQTTIDFNAKINSVEYTKTDTNLKIDAELEAKAGWLWGSARLKVSTSYQRSTQQGVNVERTYSMAVNIRAVQEEMPAGLERILGILEDAIKAQPLKAPAPAVA